MKGIGWYVGKSYYSIKHRHDPEGPKLVMKIQCADMADAKRLKGELVEAHKMYRMMSGEHYGEKD
jgi:hypothetical protein